MSPVVRVEYPGWCALTCGRCLGDAGYVHEAFMSDPDAPDPYVVCAACAAKGPPTGTYTGGYK